MRVDCQQSFVPSFLAAHTARSDAHFSDRAKLDYEETDRSLKCERCACAGDTVEALSSNNLGDLEKVVVNGDGRLGE